MRLHYFFPFLIFASEILNSFNAYQFSSFIGKIAYSKSHKHEVRFMSLVGNFENKNNMIEIYTRLGCKYCRVAKAKLNEYQIHYNEINLDNYTTGSCDDVKILDRLDIVKSLGYVPQIFIGETLIGGCDNLIKEIETEELFKRLKQLQVPYTRYTKNSVLENISESNLMNISPSEYRGSKNTTLNTFDHNNLSINISTPVNPVALSFELYSILLKLSDVYISKDGQKVNYYAMRKSELFAINFLHLTSQLAVLRCEDIQIMNDSQKLAFFINIYNVLVIHGICTMKAPENTPHGRSNFYSGKSGVNYNISNFIFSLDDIEHGLIRSNRPHPSQLNASNYFDLIDARANLKILKFDPRIHFLLNCGATSCPAINILNEGNILNALSQASMVYLDSEIRFDKTKGILYLPRLALWYSKDFGDNINNQMTYLLSLLSSECLNKLRNDMKLYEKSNKQASDEESLLMDLSEIIESENEFVVEIRYNNYDWDVNSYNN